ncbi:epoxide hydrolase family protein [uncultured Caballeronia sp.]|uniref:epoxide hydrolase family protein n=1 Tax=uncultured Caballeronia sp. TaxID=1827198 RepID=UPI0035C9F3EA
MQIEPFSVHIPDAHIEDLRRRLRDIRWPSTSPSEPWQRGVDANWLRDLTRYWADDFDWRKAEHSLNAQPQFTAQIEGQRVHFVHRKGVGPAPYPLEITHGWPGSYFEFYSVLDQLCDPAAFGGDPSDAFDVVIPSIPGFAFSQAPIRRGTSSFQVADLWASLMTGLGYARFGAQGGDLGAGVSIALASRHPKLIDGIHLNFLPGSYQPALGPMAPPLTKIEEEFLSTRDKWAMLEGGYSHMHSTRPDTLAFSLNDSPVGLAAWICEKFRAWSDCDGIIEQSFSRDELLTNLSLYWFTGSIGSSMQIYWENRLQPMRFNDGQRVVPPVGFARFPKEINHPPRSWLERTFNVSQWTDMPSGGHFAAMEEPKLLTAEIRRFFKSLRN